MNGSTIISSSHYGNSGRGWEGEGKEEKERYYWFPVLVIWELVTLEGIREACHFIKINLFDALDSVIVPSKLITGHKEHVFSVFVAVQHHAYKPWWRSG